MKLRDIETFSFRCEHVLLPKSCFAQVSRQRWATCIQNYNCHCKDAILQLKRCRNVVVAALERCHALPRNVNPFEVQYLQEHFQKQRPSPLFFFFEKKNTRLLGVVMLSQKHVCSWFFVFVALFGLCGVFILIAIGCLVGAPIKTIENSVFVTGIVFASLSGALLVVLTVLCIAKQL